MDAAVVCLECDSSADIRYGDAAIMGFQFQICAPRRKHFEAHGPTLVSSSLKAIVFGSSCANESGAGVDMNLRPQVSCGGIAGRPSLEKSPHPNTVLRPAFNDDATVAAGLDLQAPGWAQSTFLNLAATCSIAPISVATELSVSIVPHLPIS